MSLANPRSCAHSRVQLNRWGNRMTTTGVNNFAAGQPLVQRRKRTKKRTGQSKRGWRDYPAEMIAILARAGEKEFVALDGVTRTEAHSTRMKFMKMQAAFVRDYAKTPAKVVELASSVMWTLRQVSGQDRWMLVGKPRNGTVAAGRDDTLAVIVAKLGRDWQRKVEELTK